MRQAQYRRLAALQRQLDEPAVPTQRPAAPSCCTASSGGAARTVAPLPPARAIVEAEVAAYNAAGVVYLRGVFPPEWIHTMRREVDIAMADPGPFAEEYTLADRPGRFFGDLDVWRRHREFERFAYESSAAAIAAAVMQSETATFFYDQLLVKEAGTAERTPWVRDFERACYRVAVSTPTSLESAPIWCSTWLPALIAASLAVFSHTAPGYAVLGGARSAGLFRLAAAGQHTVGKCRGIHQRIAQLGPAVRTLPFYGQHAVRRHRLASTA